MLAEHGYCGEGSWQDFVVVKEGEVVKVPPEIPDEYAAQAFVNPWTVVGLMEVRGMNSNRSRNSNSTVKLCVYYRTWLLSVPEIQNSFWCR